jgi:hypothetical protein
MVFKIVFNKLIKPLEITEKKEQLCRYHSTQPCFEVLQTILLRTLDQFCLHYSLPAAFLLANVRLVIANVEIISPNQPLAVAQPPTPMRHLSPPTVCCENIAYPHQLPPYNETVKPSINGCSKTDDLYTFKV